MLDGDETISERMLLIKNKLMAHVRRNDTIALECDFGGRVSN